MNMSINASTPIADWDAYARSFLSVMPSQMLTLNREVASFMRGNVADFGCGAGKIMPFILDSARVTSYTGVDCSPEMVRNARWVASQFTEKPSTIIEDYIEEAVLTEIDSGLSINSYYTWPQPAQTLAHIYAQLKVGSVFVLVTLNADIDMPGLLQEAELELVAHPHWSEFKAHNIAISQSDNVRFVSLDELAGQVRGIGFKIEQAHKTLYSGGLNFLLLSKQ